MHLVANHHAAGAFMGGTLKIQMTYSRHQGLAVLVQDAGHCDATLYDTLTAGLSSMSAVCRSMQLVAVIHWHQAVSSRQLTTSP